MVANYGSCRMRLSTNLVGVGTQGLLAQCMTTYKMKKQIVMKILPVTVKSISWSVKPPKKSSGTSHTYT